MDFPTAVAAEVKNALRRWALHVDGIVLAVNNAAVAGSNRLEWSHQAADWADGQQVELSLEPLPTLTLSPSSLTLREGGGQTIITGTLSRTVSERTKYDVKLGRGSHEISINLQPRGSNNNADTGNIPANRDSFEVGVTAWDDTYPEATETTSITFSVTVGGANVEATLPITIEDNDSNAVVFTPERTTLVEGEWMNVTLTLQDPVPAGETWVVRVMHDEDSTANVTNEPPKSGGSWDYWFPDAQYERVCQDRDCTFEVKQVAAHYRFTSSATSHTLSLFTHDDNIHEGARTSFSRPRSSTMAR